MGMRSYYQQIAHESQYQPLVDVLKRTWTMQSVAAVNHKFSRCGRWVPNFEDDADIRLSGEANAFLESLRVARSLPVKSGINVTCGMYSVLFASPTAF